MGRGRSQTADISVSLFFLKKHLSFSFSGIDIPLDCSEILERMLNMSIATVFHKFLSFSFSGTSNPLDCSESLERNIVYCYVPEGLQKFICVAFKVSEKFSSDGFFFS